LGQIEAHSEGDLAKEEHLQSNATTHTNLRARN
jgi:hypothetical protein